MRTKNYFRAGREKVNGYGTGAVYAFFDDDSLADTERAWAEICRKVSDMFPAKDKPRTCAWRPTLHPGTWDSAQVVGYRTVEQITRATEVDAESAKELADLHKMIARRRVTLVEAKSN